MRSSIFTFFFVLAIFGSETEFYAFLPPNKLQLNCPRSFYFHLDGLAFQAKQDGMAFAIRNGHSTTPLIAGQILDFSSQKSDWKYQPGLRAGIGYFFNEDDWDLNFDWTWLNITDDKRVGAAPGNVLIPLWLTGVSSGVNIDSTSVAAVWSAEVNVLDIHIGKPYQVSYLSSMKPHIGIRTAWIDQKYSIRYNGTFENVTPVIQHTENDFWGMGLRIGVASDWKVGKSGIFFFGNAAASMVFGKFDSAQLLNFTGAIDGFDITNTTYQNIPNFEMAFGFGWELAFVRNRYHLSLRAGYEFQEWFDQLRLLQFFSGAGGVEGNGTFPNVELPRNHLTLNGFSLRVRLDL